jgi:dolichyl-phosphate-mannose-protein mannosyltransferase
MNIPTSDTPHFPPLAPVDRSDGRPLFAAAASAAEEGDARDLSVRVVLVLALITVAALGLRLGWLWALARPEDVGLDPDGYWRAARLIVRSGSWNWTYAAVRYPYLGQDYLLPPLYPAFLSFFRLFALGPGAALVAQAVLSAGCCPLLFTLARRVHSNRAGIIAALIWAVWAPSIVGGMFFMQESLHLPLLIAAFAALPPLLERPSGLRFFLSGCLFGLAALVRSMPMYFAPVACGFLFWVRRPPAAAASCAAMLLAGLVLAAGPYSASASLTYGRPILIENHGGITAGEYVGVEQGGGSPAASQAIRTYMDGALGSPGQFLSTWWRFVRSLAYLSGGRLLENHGSAPSRTLGLVQKVAVHLTADTLFILCLILAPFGVVLARRRTDASMLALWIVFAAVLTGLAAHGGARYRSPLEPFLIVLGSVVLAGGSWRAGRMALAGAGAASLLLALLVLPQIPAALEGRPEYGVLSRAALDGRHEIVVGAEGGIHVPPSSGRIYFELTARVPNGRPADVTIWVDGVHVTTASLPSDAVRPFEYRTAQPGAAFVEVSAAVPGTAMHITTR